MENGAPESGMKLMIMTGMVSLISQHWQEMLLLLQLMQMEEMEQQQSAAAAVVFGHQRRHQKAPWMILDCLRDQLKLSFHGCY